jgi:AraC-like DNA-binding protein
VSARSAASLARRAECAHRELLAADPGDESVTAVAYRWGFSSPSRFAATYREAYGVAPSCTLRQGSATVRGLAGITG